MNPNLQVVETNNQRVLTTAQIAEQYGTDSKVISNNFNRNKTRYIEGKHYYCLTGEVKRDFLNRHQIEDGSRATNFYLWTEKGALLHAKSLNTDQAWQAYEVLVDTYFSVREQAAMDSYMIADPVKRAERWIEEQREKQQLETTSLLKELGAKYVVSRAERDVQAKFLLRNGADNVVYPEKQMAKWAAIRFTADHIFDYIEIDEQHAIFEVQVPEAWVGKSVGELDVRRKFGINILGIKRAGKTDVSVTPDTVLSDDITILAMGEYKALQKCFRI